MKTLAVTLGFFLAVSAQAQILNEKGMYIDDNGGLFNGKISVTHNGTKSEMSVKDGIAHGEVTFYYASGGVMEKGTYAQGKKDQKWIRYSESGQIMATGFYLAGNKSGTWTVFDEKGNKRYEMNYDDGHKTGVWTSWDEHGVVSNTKDYGKAN